jgi:hypothetical protein
LADLESSAEPPVELEPSDQSASRSDVSGTCPHERTSIRNRAEQRDISCHNDDIEQAIEDEGGQVGLDPRESGSPAASFGDHRRVDIDSNDFDAVMGQLDGYPSRTTSCVEDRPRVQGTNKGCLTVDIHSLFGQGVEPCLVRPSVESVHEGYLSCCPDACESLARPARPVAMTQPGRCPSGFSSQRTSTAADTMNTLWGDTMVEVKREPSSRRCVRQCMGQSQR